MNREDLQREQLIDLAYFDLVSAETPEKRREAFERMRTEVTKRRSERVAEMEIERGLV